MLQQKVLCSWLIWLELDVGMYSHDLVWWCLVVRCSAMARGGSRRLGKVWTVQPSGWGYGPTTEGCGPLRCQPKGSSTWEQRSCTAAEMSAGATCRGAEASHSYSWYWRVWHHAFFAGAAKLTEEGPAVGVFECDSDGNVLSSYDGITRHGRNAQSVLAVGASQHIKFSGALSIMFLVF